MEESKPVKLSSELVELHTRKSQVDHLLRSLVCHIWETQKDVTLPDDFIASLKESFAQLPSETVVDVWIILNKELLDHYNDNEFVDKKFELVGELIWLFLENISVDQVPERTASALAAQLKETVDYVLGCLKSKYLSQTSVDDGLYVLCVLLLGCTRFFHCLPEESALFRSVIRLSLPDLESAEEFYDLSPLYPDLTTKQWKKIQRFVAKSSHQKLNLVWDRLLIRSLKVFLAADAGKKVLTRQQKLCDYLILQKLESTELENVSEWNGQISSLNAKNTSVAFWSLLLENLHTLLPSSSSGLHGAYYKAFAKVFMSVLLMNHEASKDLTMQSVSSTFLNQFCHSNGIFKLESMNSDLFSAWICSLSKLVNTHKSTSSKRVKGSVTDETVKQIFAYLENEPSSKEVFSEKGEILWPSRELFTLVNELLVQAQAGQQEAGLDDGRLQEVLKLFEIMREYLLRCLNQIDGVRCLLATLTLLAANSKHVSLVEIGLQIACGALISDQSLHLVLYGLNASHLLSFFWSLSDYAAECQSNQFNLMKQAARVMKLVLRIVMRHEQSIPLFDDFVTQTVSALTKMRKSQASSESLVKPLSRLVTCMKSAHKVLHRAYIRPAVKLLLTKSVESMQKHFLAFLKKFQFASKSSSPVPENYGLSGDAGSYFEDSIYSYLLLGFSCQLDVDQEMLDKMTSKELDDMFQHLPDLCQICLKCLQHSVNCDVLNRSLEFVVTVCNHLNSTAKFLPDDFLHKIWNGTVDVVCRFIRSPHLLLNNDSNLDSTMGRAEIISPLRKTIAAIAVAFKLDEFEEHLKVLQSNMKSCFFDRDCTKSVAAFQIIQELTTQSMSDEFQNSFYLSCQKVLVLVQELLAGCQSVPVVVAILETERKLISLGPNFLESTDLSLCLSIFSEVDLESVSCIDDFVVLFNESYAVLNALLLHQMNFVHNSIPVYMVIVKKLLRAVMSLSRQDHQRKLNQADIKKLDSCAHLIYRLSGLVCEHKIHFAKVAPFLIYEYVSEVQKGTLCLVVKTTLVMAIYKWLSICSNYGTNHLIHILPPGAKETFRFILEEFDRKSRYKGTS